LLPLSIADRGDDLRFALRLKNEKFNPEVLIQKAIDQAAGILNKRIEERGQLKKISASE
jgi:hypothetical protein